MIQLSIFTYQFFPLLVITAFTESILALHQPTTSSVSKKDVYKRQVYRHSDGSYYFTASVPEYDRIVLRRSNTLNGLRESDEVTIWKKHDKMCIRDSGYITCSLWWINR